MLAQGKGSPAHLNPTHCINSHGNNTFPGAELQTAVPPWACPKAMFEGRARNWMPPKVSHPHLGYLAVCSLCGARSRILSGMNPDQLLIINGTLLDPVALRQHQTDILLVDGRIASVGSGLRAAAPEARVLDVRDCFVAPGLLDIHVHFREPGQEHKETIATGSQAAVAGGFTTVCCMPNTTPALDTDTQIEFVLTQAGKAGLCDVLPFGAITKGRQGVELAEIMLMHEAGAIGFSDDGVGVGSAAVMFKALQYVKMIDGLISQHCEEQTLSGGSMNAGTTAMRLGLGGIPAVGEELMIARDLQLNHRIGARYHVQHISTVGAVDLVRKARQNGQQVTAEVSPHHLILTDDACDGYNTNHKMNPPLRSPADVAACIQGVVDGTIECLATDHAPHACEEKDLDFDKAPFGITGLETALPLYAQALVRSGKLSWVKLIEKMTVNPAKIVRLSDRGTFGRGMVADMVVFDPEKIWTVDPKTMRSRGHNTPFSGQQMRGKVRYTIKGGRVVYSESS